MNNTHRFAGIALLALSAALAGVHCEGQGIALRAIGTVNESMGGAGTALPLSAIGAIHWNPASIADFKCHQADFGIGLIYPDTRVSSTVGPFSGSSRSESGASPLPNMALVIRGADPRFTFGLAAIAVAGYKLNYDASLTNPIHFPQGSLGIIPTFGRVNTEAEFFQIVPTIAYTINDCWAIGAAPTLTIASLGVEPLLTAPPGAAGYSLGSGSRYTFGGGGQFGVYYKPGERFSAGVSVKTEQYFEDFRFKGQDNATGAPVSGSIDLEYPLIISLGTAWRISPRTVIANDVRWFDYASARGFGTDGLNPDGTLAGLSWSSVMAVATGISHQLNDRVTVRGGYQWNENPISSETVFFNTAAPLNVKHSAALGASVRVHPNMTLSGTYFHAFDQATSGPYAGIPGTDVTIRTAAYVLSGGVTIDF